MLTLAFEPQTKPWKTDRKVCGPHENRADPGPDGCRVRPRSSLNGKHKTLDSDQSWVIFQCFSTNKALKQWPHMTVTTPSPDQYVWTIKSQNIQRLQTKVMPANNVIIRVRVGHKYAGHKPSHQPFFLCHLHIVVSRDLQMQPANNILVLWLSSKSL